MVWQPCPKTCSMQMLPACFVEKGVLRDKSICITRFHVPVQHLVFMIHGIGQRLEKSNLVDDVTNFRHVTSSLAERHLTSHQRGTQRVLFIPCQWRKGLKLSGEAAVDKITLDGVRGLRVTLSATVHDVL
ncbi:hypothetical protein CMV_027745 [Castanea mollissima]|uniref:Uncharacterized protein n=1 Tax=Castanea mollissima TaxID=60419 RepID=A0A8J4Q660_9ROSI|nr:hypothetical protein CMV_027745 [Castanea mollissima]